jgi:hypothetical protein
MGCPKLPYFCPTGERSGDSESDVSFNCSTECIYRAQVMCEANVDETLLVYFDDHMYFHFLNNIDNNWKSYNSISEEEDNLVKSASIDDSLASYERMFDLDLKRDESWCGKVCKMAFIPCLKRNMLTQSFTSTTYKKKILEK